METANVLHVSSSALDIGLPSPSTKSSRSLNSHFTLGEGVSDISAKGEQIVRQGGTGKCTIESQRLFAQDGHLHAQHGRISRGRE